MTTGNSQPSDRRPCPFCGELIVTAAVLCRYCNRELPRNWATVVRPRADLQGCRWVRRHPIVFVFALLGAVLLLIRLFPGPSPPPTTASKPREFSQSDSDRMTALIQLHGFSCKKAVSMRDMIFGGGFVVKCDGVVPDMQYWFNIEDHGGKWTVEAKGFGQ